MSLLELLMEKRNKLNPTTTVVTTAAGERFLENFASAASPVKLERQRFGFVEDTKPDQVPAEIESNFLYLGSQDAVTIENCAHYKFTHILSVGVNVDMTGFDSSIEHMFLPLLDLPETRLFDDDNNKDVSAAFKFIDKANSQSNGRILVHCNAGVSRSASIVIAYIMKTQTLSFDDAYKLVKSKRQSIQPNTGFVKQLKELDFER